MEVYRKARLMDLTTFGVRHLRPRFVSGRDVR